MSHARAVLSAEQLSGIRAPIERASTLPADAYYCDEFYEAERQAVFSRHWVAALFDFDVAGPGDALPFELCGMPLLAVRDNNGKLRVFHNIVPYDGCLAMLEPAQGLTQIETPYHGWQYDLQGKLTAIPFWDGTEFPDLEAVGNRETGLVEVHCETYLHTVFINLSRTPASFQEYVAPVARQFTDYDLREVVVATDTSGVPIVPSSVTRANWKIFFDIDGPNVLHEHFVHSDYRNSSLHPRVDRNRKKTYQEVIDGYFIGPKFRHRDFAETYGAVDPLEPHLGRGGRLPEQAGFLDLYPSMSFSISPGHIEIGINLPMGPDKTVDRRMYLIPPAAATDDKAAEREKIFGFFGTVAPEDNRISEAVQRAAHSPVCKERFFSPFWDRMRHRFHQWVAEDLASHDTRSSEEGVER